MKKKVFILLVFIYLFSVINVYATSAHNIYSDPQIDTNTIYDTFTIDFQGTQTPNYTYWALSNWGMDLNSFKQNHSNVEGGGAYAGLQTNEEGRRSAIMSFWEVSYDNGQKIRAKMIYPVGETNSFTGEGEGSNFITNYNWKTNSWYRMVIHSWDNKETNTTYVAQWFLDLSTREWTLISVFDTNLPSSGMRGNFSQFQENYIAATAKEIREFNFKNMYVRKKSNSLWYSLGTTKLSYDTKAFGYDTAGRHEFGVRDNMFYGLSGGTVDNQDRYDREHPDYQVLSINQSDTPPIELPKLTSTLTSKNGTVTIDWKFNGPQKEYTIYVIDRDSYNTVNTISVVNPATNQVTFNDDSQKHLYELVVKDIYGNTRKTFSKANIQKQIEKEKTIEMEEENDSSKNKLDEIVKSEKEYVKKVPTLKPNVKKEKNYPIIKYLLTAFIVLLVLSFILRVILKILKRNN